MKRYTIKDVETLTGIKSHTLRIWEQRYEFVAPRRTETNIRFYTEPDLKKLLNIKLLNDNGFKLCNLALMAYDDICNHVVSICEDCQKEDGQLQRLYMSTINFKQSTFIKILDTNFRERGVVTTMSELIRPFQKNLKSMLCADCLCSAHDQFSSNLIRERLLLSINKLNKIGASSGLTYLLFLPESEFHEIDLLFAHYLLKFHRNDVIYLGQNIPLKSLIQSVQKINPDFILSSIQGTPSNAKTVKYLLHLAERMPNNEILVESHSTFPERLKQVKNITYIHDIKGLIKLIEDRSFVNQ